MEDKDFIFNEETKEITFKIYNNPYDEDKPLFNLPNESLTIKPGVTCLLGCNGYGKSTIINRISEIYKCNKNEFELVEFNDRQDGGNTLMQKATLQNDFTTVATLVQSSEGERIMVYFSEMLSGLRYRIINNKKKAFIITIDIDSGLSIDKIDLIKDIIVNHVAKEAKNVYIIMAVISYEFAKGLRCIDANNGSEVQYFIRYEQYANFIRKTAEVKRKRLEK